MCASSDIHLNRGGCTLTVSGGCIDGIKLDDLDPSDLRESTMSRLSPLPRSRSRASLAPSETTYHSFLDSDVPEPTAVFGEPVALESYCDAPTLLGAAASKGVVDPAVAQPMRRQDSGYESLSPRHSYSSRHRTSSITNSTHRPRTRPSLRRSAASGPTVSHLPGAHGQSLFHRRPTSQSIRSHQPGTFFHFPNFASHRPEQEETELVVDTRLAQDLNSSRPYTAAAVHQEQQGPRSETPTFPLPPQTTHYWTSDRTRRLEYAAIDAASQGVRGWVMRYMVPDCFVPKERRRMRFEDDRGSVVRYRIDLEGEEKDDCGKSRRRRSWWFSS